ncbi:PAS domain protein [Tepidimonas thermarum]|uniref:PAS domain protein n=1 Tax=Tepidimonas thermarum TaxID=335431 RepID=A0A554WWZ9_9BURK|nr:PAS domain protein [Tepidimonas thermarum]
MLPALDDYRLAFEWAPVGLVLSRHRTMVDCNQAVCEMFGASREDCATSFL